MEELDFDEVEVRETDEVAVRESERLARVLDSDSSSSLSVIWELVCVRMCRVCVCVCSVSVSCVGRVNMLCV